MAKAPILHAVPYIRTQGIIAHTIGGPCQNFHYYYEYHDQEHTMFLHGYVTY
jgi:hypothetical protein